MFLLDNLLLGPSKAALLVLRELAKKAQAEWLDDDAIKQQLQDIYTMVEAGKITTQEFEAMECQLLERLEQIAKAKYQDKWGPTGADNVVPALADDQPRVEITHSIQPLFAFDTIDVTPPSVAALPAATSSCEPPVELPEADAAPAVIATPHVVVPPPPAAPVMAMTPAPSTAPLLSIPQVIDSASRAVAMLNRKVSAITSVVPGDDGWRVTVEMVERRGVPDTSDVLGVYELRLDPAGNVTRYERTRLRRRCDISR
jgi:hypothetical protein